MAAEINRRVAPTVDLAPIPIDLMSERGRGLAIVTAAQSIPESSAALQRLSENQTKPLAMVCVDLS